MSFLPVTSIDLAQIHVELHYGKPKAGETKPKPQIKVTYGPARRALALLTPPVVVDWPMLSGDGNFGTKFGPDDVDKAEFRVGISDKVPSVEGASQSSVQAYFNLLRAIDEKVVECVWANQTEILKEKSMTLEQVRAKLMPTVKPKKDDAGDTQYHRQTLGLKKYGWRGEERSVKIVDKKLQPTAEPVSHEDVCMLATQLDFVYTGLLNGHFGCKWVPVEVCLLKKAPGLDDFKLDGGSAFGGTEMPSWAEEMPQSGPPPEPVRQPGFIGESGFGFA